MHLALVGMVPKQRNERAVEGKCQPFLGNKCLTVCNRLVLLQLQQCLMDFPLLG